MLKLPSNIPPLYATEKVDADDPSGVADINLVRTPLCKKCNVPMKEGEALQNQLVGGDFRGATLSHTGPAQMVKVWKCPDCGHSFTK